MTRPGLLSLDDWRGRRARYLPPLRLYLIASFVLFLVVGLLGAVEGRSVFGGGLMNISIPEDPDEIPEVDWEQTLERASAFERLLISRIAKPLTEDPRAIFETAMEGLPVLFFLLVPILALELRLLFWNRDVRYVEHLVFALHVQAFLFLLITVENLARALLPLNTWTAALTGLATQVLIALYLCASMRRAYGGRTIWTVLRLLVLLGLHGTVLIAGVLVLLGVSTL